MEQEEQRKPRCHNCTFAGTQFKIHKLTHLHCENPKEFNQERWDAELFTPWDSLRVFNNTCSDHEFKPAKKRKNG